jgi:Lrp/AsnC family transcriptional regulator for asnA, asnC and gidA
VVLALPFDTLVIAGPGPFYARVITSNCEEPTLIGAIVVAGGAHESNGLVEGTVADRPHAVDDLDRKIIKMLQVNGRLSNTQIGRALAITETTVRKRIAHLLDERLMNIVAVPTPEAVGMNLSAIIGISVDLTAMYKVGDVLRTFPEVRYVGMSAGRYDIMVEVFFRDQEHLLEFVTDKLGTLPGITSLETSIILKVVKFSYEWEIV